MKCFILAGGFATRLYPLTLSRAKALLEYKGEPVISHALKRVPWNIDTYVSTNRRFLADFLDWQRTLKRQVEICVEDAVSDEQKKGAVSAIDYWVKSKKITEDLLVIAADNYFDMNLSKMLTKYDGINPLIAVFDVGDKDRACEIGKSCQVGLAILEGNRIVRLDEKPQIATSSIISTGIYILPSSSFSLLSDYCLESKRDNMGEFINYLVRKVRVCAFKLSGNWVDIGDEIKRGRIVV